MGYDDIVEKATTGVAKGLLDWSLSSIKNLAQKFRDKKLAFIQDEETIKIVKEQLNSGELNFYKIYIQDEEILFLTKIGLTLRRLENNLERRKNLRDKVHQKYEVRGLHIAQFVENGLLNTYIGILIENLTSIQDFKDKILKLLTDIEKYVLFVRKEDNERNVIQNVRTKVFANSPSIFVISGISAGAEIVKKCEGRITILLTDYELKKISSGLKENLFYKRIFRD